jgi:hypothetical protein
MICNEAKQIQLQYKTQTDSKIDIVLITQNKHKGVHTSTDNFYNNDHCCWNECGANRSTKNEIPTLKFTY